MATQRYHASMKTAWLRLYAELNDFLPPRTRQQPLAHSFAGRTSVKDAIEAHGVPHTEIDLILVNGQSVDFSYLLDDGDRTNRSWIQTHGTSAFGGPRRGDRD